MNHLEGVEPLRWSTLIDTVPRPIGRWDYSTYIHQFLSLLRSLPPLANSCFSSRKAAPGPKHRARSDRVELVQACRY